MECKVVRERDGLESVVDEGVEQTAGYVDRCAARGRSLGRDRPAGGPELGREGIPPPARGRSRWRSTCGACDALRYSGGMTVADTWDLESIFAGGSASAEFRDFVAELERDDVAAAGERVRALDESAPDAEVRAVLLDAQAAEERLDQAFSFAECPARPDTPPTPRRCSGSGGSTRWGHRSRRSAPPCRPSRRGSRNERWRTLTESAELRPVAFLLSRERDLARRKLDARTEGLVEELAADGYHAWDRQYTTLAGSLRAEVEVEGESRRLSMGQLAARLEEPARADSQGRLRGAGGGVASGSGSGRRRAQQPGRLPPHLVPPPRLGLPCSTSRST